MNLFAAARSVGALDVTLRTTLAAAAGLMLWWGGGRAPLEAVSIAAGGLAVALVMLICGRAMTGASKARSSS